jgi:hypothetical protein
MLWGFDGPGIRTLFLLPISPREIVLTKNVGWFLSALAELTAILVVLSLLRPATVVPHLALVITGWLALAFVAAVAGTWVSVRHPTRPPERGLARRNPGGAVGLGAVLSFFLAAGVVVLAVVVTRSFTPDPYKELASVIVTTLMACASGAVWWIGVERNADLLVQNRERMIDVLAKGSDA